MINLFIFSPQARKAIPILTRLGLAIAVTISAPGALYAQNPETYSEAVKVPVFESVDVNGVDLTSGQLRLRSPVLTMGSGEGQYTYGLEWTGQSWKFIGVPTISRDGDRFYVTFEGQSYEFNDYGDDWSERKPVMGASIRCSITLPQNHVDFCTFTGRHGEIVHFQTTMWNNWRDSNFGYQSMGLGNLGISSIKVMSPRYSDQYYYHFTPGVPAGYGFDIKYNLNKKFLELGGRRITIITPGHDGTHDKEHYLTPKSTIQTFTDDFGSQWKYQVNGDREIVQVVRPGGLSSINYTYISDRRVSSVVTADGTWTYAYSNSGNIRTVLVTAPGGRQFRVRSHKDLGYVTEYVEGNVGTASERKTVYTYDSNERLTRVTYPDGNYDTYLYDARGNVTEKKSYPVPARGGDILTWEMVYPATCTNRVTCNSPLSVKDPENNVTEFEYAPTGLRQILSDGRIIAGGFRDYGEHQPSVVRYPAATPGAPRRTVSYEYTNGKISKTSTCISSSNCAGTADEIVTEIEYASIPRFSLVGGIEGTTSSNALLINDRYITPVGETVTVNGETRRTCYVLDTAGRVVSVIPPSANPPSCSTTLVTPQGPTANSPSASPARAVPTYSQ